VAAELPLHAIASLLGVPQHDRHVFMDWADTTLDYEDRDPGETSTRSQKASAAMFAYSTRLLDAKRGCPADDILSIIATATPPDGAEPAGPMTDLEQQMFFNLLIAAGSETTRT
jgi:cytochrome P450